MERIKEQQDSRRQSYRNGHKCRETMTIKKKKDSTNKPNIVCVCVCVNIRERKIKKIENNINNNNRKKDN